MRVDLMEALADLKPVCSVNKAPLSLDKCPSLIWDIGSKCRFSDRDSNKVGSLSFASLVETISKETMLQTTGNGIILLDHSPTDQEDLARGTTKIQMVLDLWSSFIGVKTLTWNPVSENEGFDQ